LSGSWGSGLNFRWNQWGRGDWSYRFHRHGDFYDSTTPAWLIALIVIGVLLAIVLALVWMWVSSRGRFIFTDCIVKNRGAIAEPWREYRREGNSYFLFSLAIAFGAFVIVAIAGLFIWLIFFRMHGDDAGPGTVIGVIALVVIALIWIVFAVFFGVVSAFMVPVMYRRRCLAREAFVDVAKLIGGNPGPFVLFVLFGIA